MKHVDDIWVVYKPLLWTPLQVINALKEKNPELRGVKITYVGRLDPLAEGVMLLLSGEMISQKPAFLSLTKTYEFDLLLGLSTDSYDLMGIPSLSKLPKNFEMTTVRLTQLLAELVGSIRQPYPPFSGKTIEGIKMFELAKTGRLDHRKIPSQTGTIFEATLLSSEKVPFGYLRDEMERRVLSVEGDFRQREILTAWHALSLPMATLLPSYRIRLSCSSGLFVRSIAHDLGKKLNLGGLSSHILRTHVGGYSLEDCIHLSENIHHG